MLTRTAVVDQPPFVADAIIANPPGMAHIHCAERLVQICSTFFHSSLELKLVKRVAHCI